MEANEVTKVELFECIRHDHFIHGKSIRQIAQERRIHRRMVRQAIKSAVPPRRRDGERPRPKLANALRGVVDEWLRGDRDAPRKQRHTARRIYQRLCKEHGYEGAESTIRGYVATRRRELVPPSDVYVPQTHAPGEEAEVDWYEAEVDFPSERRRVHVFEMRACYSGREFHMAFPRESQQAFLEGFVAAFAYFGGVFEIVRLDNLKLAVRKVLRGRRREETERFIGFRSHYLFESEYCRPGKVGAPEKGGVEGGVGRFRRTHLVPVPKVESWTALNEYLRKQCRVDDGRCIEGRSQTVAEMWAEEMEQLRSLPSALFGTAAVNSTRVDAKSRVVAQTNRYSVPVKLAHRMVEVRAHAFSIEIFHAGRVVARHERLLGRHEQRLELDHYVELLERKPGALERSEALRQAREQGRWPASYDEFWRILRERYEETAAAEQMVELLFLHRDEPIEEIAVAIELALAYGCVNVDGVRTLLRQLMMSEKQAQPMADLGTLSQYERPVDRDLSIYDRLLAGVEVVQ